MLDSVSCDFEDTGFYLLLGESGSGKTTFLNILAGFMPFESGSIAWNEQNFTVQVEGGDIDYITQDSNFVDFLSVMDNLRLVSDSDEQIKETLYKFKLDEKKNQLPVTLSGGERQRLAIIRALLSGRKVLLLDEPTAALDEDNKIAVFELLRQLKSSTLIICSSHDSQALQYADEVLHFSKVKNRSADMMPARPVKLKKAIWHYHKHKNINRFLRKWFVSKRRNRKSLVLFTIFLVLSMCLCIFADLPQNRLDSSIKNLYGLNMFTVEVYGKNNWDDIAPSEKGIKEVVLDYSASVSDGNESLDPNVPTRPTPDYELAMYTLPFSADAFKLSSEIRYGTYFTEANQVILTWEMAEALYPSAPEKLIGESLTKNLYGLGQVKLEIVGIFDAFNDIDKKYLDAIGIHIAAGDNYDPENYTDLYFINGKLTEQFEQDEGFYNGSGQRRGYRVYFDSYQTMKRYYDQYYDILNNGTTIRTDYSTINVSLFFTFETLFKISLPVAFFMVMFAILFYISLIKTEFVYNNRFVSVFEYSGYSKSAVINHFILLNIWELIKIELIATVIAIGITGGVNSLNSKYMFIPFQIFSYNLPMIGAFLIFMILWAGILVYFLFRRVKVVSWYENLISSRDLI